jgi:hypothetical protein
MSLLAKVPSAYLWLLRLPSTAEAALRNEAERFDRTEAARVGAPPVSPRLLFSDRSRLGVEDLWAATFGS